MTLTEITTKLQEPGLTPRDLSELRLWLSGEFGVISGKLEKILISKPGRWLTMRSQEGIKSDKQADRLWDMTQDGQNEVSYRMQLKVIEKQLSSIKSRLDVMNAEARNQY